MYEHAEIEIVRRVGSVMLPPTATVMMAARLMHSRMESAVLVVEGEAMLVGIFTERDAISRVLAEGRDPIATTLAEVMTDNPRAVAPGDPADEIVALMRQLHCRHLPIVDGDRAVGIVSRGRFLVRGGEDVLLLKKIVQPQPSASDPACV